MKILSIKFRNLNSLEGENTIDFTASPIAETGLFAITGDTGAGKSTILDAITLALYGRIHRNKNVFEVMTYGTTSAFAEITFDVDGKTYMAQWTVWRARNKVDGNIQGPQRKLSLKNEVSDTFEIIAEKIREVDDNVDIITGLDYDRFCRSVLLSQGDFAAFLKANEKDRSILLERITGTEIYSNISKGAYEKNKQEELKLDQIKQQLQSLEILTDEEIAEIKDEEKELKNQLLILSKKLKEDSSQLKSLERIEKLAKEINQVHDDLANWSSDKENLKEDLERHQIHLKTRNFHDKILDRKRILSETSQYLDDIYNLKEIKNNYLSEIKLLQVSWNNNKELLNNIKAKQDELYQKLDKVTQLDTEIKTRTEALEPKQKEWKELNAIFKTKSKEQGELKKEIETTQTHYKELLDWISKNKTDEKLREDLPHIEIPLKKVIEEKGKLIKINKEYENHITKKSKLDESLLKLKEKLKKENKSFNELKQQYATLDPDDDSFSGNNLSRQLQKEIEELNQIKNDLKQLSDLNRDYKKEMRDMEEYESEWESLENEEYIRIRTLLSREDELNSIQQKFEYKKGIYEQQKALKDYELERNELEEGKPCPLCLSTEHPFRVHNYTPRPDLAKEELDLVEKQFKQFEKLYESEKSSLEKIADKKEFLRGDGKEIAGQINRTTERMLEFENKISEVIKSLAEEGLTLLDTGVIQERIRDIAKQIEFKKNVQLKISKLSELILTKEDSLQAFENKLKDENFNLTRLDDDIKHIEEEKNELENNIKNESKIILKYFKKYNIKSNLYDFNIFDSLKSRKNGFINKKELSEKYKEELLLNETEEKNLTENINDLKLRLDKILEEGKKERTELESLKNKRYALLDKSLQPDGERLKHQNQLISAEEKENTNKVKLDELTLLLEGKSTTLKEKEKTRATLLHQLDKIETQLQSFIEKEKIASLDLLENSILNNEELTQIESKEKLLNERYTRLKQSEESLEKELEQLQDKTDEDLDLKILKEDIEKQTIETDGIKETLGRFKERIEKNNERRSNSKSLTKSLAAQQKECLKWSKLNELIGQHDGKKFRVFAQGLTLKRLTDLANLHLQSLNERYQIYKPLDKDLELEIIDTYQANHSRSVNTLSGGESFLVSLALALGLSDLAGRNTQIGSLFIDEGFGTLDNDTLEIALQTLERLQNTGKTIGVISHIQQLKERINTQILVEKKGNGYSTIQILS